MKTDRDPATGLDPWPSHRPNEIVVEVNQGGRYAYVFDLRTGARLLRIPGHLVIHEEVVEKTVFEYDDYERSA